MWFFLWDDFHLRVFPSPDQTYTFTLFGLPWPPEINSSNEDIVVNGVQLDRQFKLAMAYRIAAGLLIYTRPDAAAQYTKMAEECFYYYRKRLRQQNSNNLRRLKPLVSGRMDSIVGGATKGVLKIGRRLS